MPCPSMYLDRPDITLLLARLNDDPEVAFLVLAGRKTRPAKRLQQLLASSQGFTVYSIGGMSSLVHVENRGIAVPRLENLPDGRYMLWHVPSSPLPLLYGNQSGQRGPACDHPHAGRAMTLAQALGREGGVIEDPWSGWVERRPGADPRQPYFGPGHPGVIDLEVATRPVLETFLAEDLVTVRREVRDEQVLGVFRFGWIGNQYRQTGSTAPPATERWWRRLRQ